MAIDIPQKSVSGRFAFFDGMTWPTGIDSEEDGKDSLQWKLRYGEPSAADLLVAASIVSAYRKLVHSTSQRWRNQIIAKIRLAVKEDTL